MDPNYIATVVAGYTHVIKEMTRSESGNLLLIFNRSNLLKQYFVYLHALVLVAVIANDLVLLIKLTLVISVALHGGFFLYRSPIHLVAIKYTEIMGWEISTGIGFISVDVLKSTVITTQALFLHFKFKSDVLYLNRWRKSAFLVVSDMVSDQDYRHLLVKLHITGIK